MDQFFHDFWVKIGSKNKEKSRGKLEEKLVKMKGHIKVWKCRKHCKTHRKINIFQKSKKTRRPEKKQKNIKT